MKALSSAPSLLPDSEKLPPGSSRTTTIQPLTGNIVRSSIPPSFDAERPIQLTTKLTLDAK